MSLLSATTEQKLEDALIKDGFLTSSQIDDLKFQANEKGIPFLSYLVSDGHISTEALTKIQAHINKLPYVNLSEAYIDPVVLQLLPQETAEQYMAVPLGEMQHYLVVAMLEADNVQAVDFLTNKIGRPIKVYAASEDGIKKVLKEYQTIISKDVAESFTASEAGQEAAQSIETGGGGTSRRAIKTLSEDSPISKTLSTILEFAAKNRASDIHIEPMENKLKVRCRIDGILREVIQLPKSTESALVSRIKILSSLKIDEHRIPQDGEFVIKLEDKEIDLRVAISPVVWGEQVVIRLLDKSGTSLNLEDMGYTGRALRSIREALKQPNGMILTSGPTGSGKSTSLYALIQEIKSDAVNIVTLEDPVEYKMPGINQIQVNADVGLTFATGLRSILRQDPDIVMVGEIRDQETASLAVQASLTGHLVFSTLHTNSAAGILPRLLDMGIEPFLIASTVHTVIGQRLVRRIGGDKQKFQTDAVLTEAIHSTIGHLLPEKQEDVAEVAKNLGYSTLPLRKQDSYTLFKGTDSPESPDGYKGRVGLYEVFDVTNDIQNLILKRATSAEIQKVAQSQGMIDMRQDGYLKALAGFTTLEEVDRVAATDAA
jgi:type IV pilus assembly protein PilB